MFGVERTSLVFKFNLLPDIGNWSSFWIFSGQDLEIQVTTTSMNMTVDLDTDPIYEDTTEKAVEVVSPLNALISDQMERRKSLKSAKKYCTHKQCFVNNILTIIH